MKKLALIVLLLMLAPQSHAGGNSELVKIIDFNITHESSDGFVLQFSPIDGLWQGAHCTRVKIVGDFDAKRWEEYRRPMSQSNHREAIDLLIVAHDKNEVVYFGTVGGGVKQVKPCEYLSKGLFGGQYQNGMTFVFSIYNRI